MLTFNKSSFFHLLNCHLDTIGELGRVVVCGLERFRGELFEENLEGNLEGRQGNESKSLLNDRTTSGEEG